MKPLWTIAFLLPLTALAWSATNCTQIQTAVRSGEPGEFGFDLTARVALVSHELKLLALEDEGGAISLNAADKDVSTIANGDVVRVEGRVCRVRGFLRCLNLKRFEVLGHGPAMPPRELSAEDVFRPEHDHRLVRFRTTVRDVVEDEIDSHVTWIVLAMKPRPIYAFVTHEPGGSSRLPAGLIGAKVAVSGILVDNTTGYRFNLGRSLRLTGPEAIEVLSDADSDFFSAPDADRLLTLHPLEFIGLDRHRVHGTVVAIRHARSALVKTGFERYSEVSFSGQEPPAVGQTVEAVGLPESDLYHVNLVRARWRESKEPPQPLDEALTVEIQRLFTDVNGIRGRYDPYFHGRTVRLGGEISEINETARTFRIVRNGIAATVDASALPDFPGRLVDGSSAELTGTCYLEIEPWRPNTLFPGIAGAEIILNGPEGLKITALPSPLTIPRLLAALAVVTLMLVAAGIWTVLLRRLVTKRTEELKDEIISRVGSEFKVQERTRLAVELHDAVSQNLTGVSLELQTLGEFGEELPSEARRHLAIASRTLGSCRQELKDCLWDLRHDTLGEEDFAKAVQRTLAPRIGKAELTIRISIPRELLRDDTAHMILTVLRELAANAVRHGHATAIRVAGAIEDGKLLFSVRDNGTGFDAESVPGPEDGHFGLLGISERIAAHEGEFTIESHLGHGTRAVIAIRLSGRDKP